MCVFVSGEVGLWGESWYEKNRLLDLDHIHFIPLLPAPEKNPNYRL